MSDDEIDLDRLLSNVMSIESSQAAIVTADLTTLASKLSKTFTKQLPLFAVLLYLALTVVIRAPTGLTVRTVASAVAFVLWERRERLISLAF